MVNTFAYQVWVGVEFKQGLTHLQGGVLYSTEGYAADTPLPRNASKPLPREKATT